MGTLSAESNIEDLVKQIYRLGTVRRQLLGHALPELGGQGFTALASIYRWGPSRVSDVARHLGVDLSVASRQVQVLTKVGYIERQPDPDDGRAQLLTVTEAGMAALRDSHRKMVEASSLVLADWHEREVSDLIAGLERLRAAFTGETDSDETGTR